MTPGPAGGTDHHPFRLGDKLLRHPTFGQVPGQAHVPPLEQPGQRNRSFTCWLAASARRRA